MDKMYSGRFDANYIYHRILEASYDENDALPGITKAIASRLAKKVYRLLDGPGFFGSPTQRYETLVAAAKVLDEYQLDYDIANLPNIVVQLVVQNFWRWRNDLQKKEKQHTYLSPAQASKLCEVFRVTNKVRYPHYVSSYYCQAGFAGITTIVRVLAPAMTQG